NVTVANRFRDRLLGCLDRALLVTPEAIARRTALEDAGGAPENRPDPKIEVFHSEFTQDDFLRERGVPVEDPEHQRLLAILQPLAQFTTEFLNGTPPAERITAILPSIRALEAEASAIETLHSQLKSQSLIDLNRTCDAILRNDQYPWDSETLDLIRV